MDMKLDKEALALAARAVLHRRIEDDFMTVKQHADGTRSWAVSHDEELAKAAVTAYLAALERTPAGERTRLASRPPPVIE